MRVETRVLIGGWKSRQRSLSSVKVNSTHKMECSLVFFINQADRLGPENQIKNCSQVLLPVAPVQVPNVGLSSSSCLLWFTFPCLRHRFVKM